MRVIIAAICCSIATQSHASMSWEGEDPAILLCEAYVMASLRSPSSYQRVKADMVRNYVIIEYDAQNGFGAVIRGEFPCQFSFYSDGFYLESSFKDQNFHKKLLAKAASQVARIPLKSSDTSLKPSVDDFSINACISTVLNTGSYGATWPDHNLLTITMAYVNERRPTEVMIVSDVRRAPSDFPTSILCDVSKAGDVTVRRPNTSSR